MTYDQTYSELLHTACIALQRAAEMNTLEAQELADMADRVRVLGQEATDKGM